jgi:hypothetical protein
VLVFIEESGAATPAEAAHIVSQRHCKNIETEPPGSPIDGIAKPMV